MEKNVGARRLSGMVFLQLLLMIPSFGRPLSQLLAWNKHPCAWAREQFLERGTLLCHITIHSLGTTLHVQYRFDDEVKDDAHGAFTPEMLKPPQATWISTFVEGVTDKSTGLPLFSELAWFAYNGTRSLVSCAHRLCVSTAGLSRDGFTLKGGIGSIRR